MLGTFGGLICCPTPIFHSPHPWQCLPALPLLALALIVPNHRLISLPSSARLITERDTAGERSHNSRVSVLQLTRISQYQLQQSRLAPT